jgi:predicted CXXCH cytochrome family protein
MLRRSSLAFLLAALLVLALTSIAFAAYGPHGGYLDTTNKCLQCHDVHEAASVFKLLPQSTVYDTCNYCHDGSTARKVYTRISTPGAQHDCEVTTTVPGSSPNTLDSTLTCSSCHSPHDNNTVAVFVGDSTDLATNRLLKLNPNANYDVGSYTEYGAAFCADCHANRMSGTTLNNHPVSTPTVYDTVSYWDGTTNTATIGLGRSNAGYVMRDFSGQDDPDPICQQCHEDSRDVETAFTHETTGWGWPGGDPSQYGYDSDGNPQWSLFPHETVNTRFRVESGDDLCLNCHESSQLP